nr:uncharacterized protein LOC104110073 [Nicotiana tomentosiformis]
MVIEDHKFSDIIKLGEKIEEGIKSGMLTNFEALQAANKALQSGCISKLKKKKEVSAVMVAQGPRTPLTYQTPPPSYKHIPPTYHYPTIQQHVYDTQPVYFQSPPPTYQNYPRPRANFERRPPRQYTPLAELIAQLYERLKVEGYITTIPPAVDTPTKWVNPNKSCAYHSGMKWHTLEECRSLKDKIQTLIDTKLIHLKRSTPNVHNNPLPDHKEGGVHMIDTDEEWDEEGSIGFIRDGDTVVVPPVVPPPAVVRVCAPFVVELAVSRSPFTFTVAPSPVYNSRSVPWDYEAEARRKGKSKIEEAGATQGMTRTGRVYTPESMTQGGSSKENMQRPPVVEVGVEEIWRKVQAKEYSVVKHLNKTPAQISILSLLQNSDAHKNALMNVLSEAYVPANITSKDMANMVGHIFETHKISFHEYELPPEGLSHNKALHITVQHENKFIFRVLIDGDSSLNICPLTTLRKFGINLFEIHEGSMNVKAFDRSQRATIGEIHLRLKIEPTVFDVEFQVLDISTTYNLLLGRPWIHMAGAVASTLHQVVKFEWDHQEVVVHRDGNNPINTNQTVPVVDIERNVGGGTFYTIELVGNIEQSRWWSDRVMSMILWLGYEPGRGLGPKLEGIAKPVQPRFQKTTFGLGYKYTSREFKDWTPPWSGFYYPLPKPIPHLHQTFRKAETIWGDKADNILEGVKNLFLSEHEDNGD